MVAVSETPNPREEFSFADRGKLIAELRAENERLWRIEEDVRELVCSDERSSVVAKFRIRDVLDANVASEPEDR